MPRFARTWRSSASSAIPGVGYRIDELTTALRQVLGIDRDWPLALVGLGNLGRALLKYRGFRTRGFQIVAVFDNDPGKIGQYARWHEGRADRGAPKGRHRAGDQPGECSAFRPKPPSAWPT